MSTSENCSAKFKIPLWLRDLVKTSVPLRPTPGVLQALQGSVRTTEAALKNQPAQPRTAACRRTSPAPESIAAALVGENRGPTAGEIHPEAAAVMLLLWASSFSFSMPDDTSFRHASTRLGGKTKERYWVEASLDFSKKEQSSTFTNTIVEGATAVQIFQLNVTAHADSTHISAS